MFVAGIRTYSGAFHMDTLPFILLLNVLWELFCSYFDVVFVYSVHRMRGFWPAAWAVVGSAMLTRPGHVQGGREKEKEREKREGTGECVESQVDCWLSQVQLRKGGEGGRLIPLLSPLFSLVPRLSSLFFSSLLSPLPPHLLYSLFSHSSASFLLPTRTTPHQPAQQHTALASGQWPRTTRQLAEQRLVGVSG